MTVQRIPVYRRSSLNGLEKVWWLPVTEEQLDELSRPCTKRRAIQDIFPDLSRAAREFLLTGYTPHDWRVMFTCEGCGDWMGQCSCEDEP
jgi:hypothetical protein